MVCLESTFILVMVWPTKGIRLKEEVERLDEMENFIGWKVWMVDFMVQLWLNLVFLERLKCMIDI